MSLNVVNNSGPFSGSLPYYLPNSNPLQYPNGSVLTTTSGTWTTTSIPNGPSTSSPNTTVGTSVWYDYNDIVKNNPLQKLNYIVNFEIDKDDMLKHNIKGIRKNKFLFKCDYLGNRIQPYEFIMKLIEGNKKFSVKIEVSDILTICYTNLQFIKIENNLDFDTECDFSVLKVNFKYEKILYENHKLSEKELRAEKLKKIMAKEDN
jgi:hypothetical protein